MYSLWFPDSCHLHGSLVRLFFGAILLKIKYIIPEVAKENKQRSSGVPHGWWAEKKSHPWTVPSVCLKSPTKGNKHTEISARCTFIGDEHQENNLSQFWVPFPTNKRLTLNKHDDFGICCWFSSLKIDTSFNVVCFDFSWGHPEPTTKVYRIYPVFPV